MVGLRWWNYVDDDGKSHWVFESRKVIATQVVKISVYNTKGSLENWLPDCRRVIMTNQLQKHVT